MKRLGVLLDDVAIIRSSLGNDTFDPVQFGILAETAGANGLVCSFSGSDNGIRERDLRIAREISKTFFNMRIPVEEDALRLALSLTPDMITFVNLRKSDPKNVQPVDPAIHFETIQQMLSDLQANNISVSTLIRPEINILKQINKLSVDYIELDVTGYTTAIDINEELVELDKIKSSAMGAAKLGMGVNCSGKIRFEHIPALSRVPHLEDITIGAPLIQRSMLVGVEKAINEALQMIRHREID